MNRKAMVPQIQENPDSDAEPPGGCLSPRDEAEPPGGRVPTEVEVEPPSGTLSLVDEVSPPRVAMSFIRDFSSQPVEVSPPSIKTVEEEKEDRVSNVMRVITTGRNLTISARTRKFMRKYFPNVTRAEWNDWHWQLRNRIRDQETLARMVRLADDEQVSQWRTGTSLPLSITPYYASLLAGENPYHPLHRAVVPSSAEFMISTCEAADPLHEDHDSPVPGLVHRYPDRVLFLITDFCSVYCRYCTRSRMVGATPEATPHRENWERVLDYIASHTEIRDVLLSGGDPLTLSDDHLEWLLQRLKQIPHVEFVRIGSKVPVVLPQRITPSLVKMLRKYHPLWMSIHFTHPDELTPEVEQACGRLADAGIPLGSQTVLLAGINDDVDTMKRLVHGLLKFRVKPYYIYQCDPIYGSSHFRTSVEKGIEIISGLRGYTTGYAVPTYVIDAPGGGGKIPIFPETIIGRDKDELLIRNFRGNTYRYPDPAAGPHTLGDGNVESHPTEDEPTSTEDFSSEDRHYI